MRVLIRSKDPARNLTLYYIDPLSGKEVTRSAGTKDRREAERAAALWEQELLAFHGAHGEGWGNFRQRFEDEHLATLAGKGIAYQTALNHYERIMKPATVEITASDVSTFKAKLLAEGKRLASVASYLRHLGVAVNWAAQMKMCQPIQIKLPKQPNRKFMRGRPLTEVEYKAMHAACNEPALRRFMELLWYSGMRLREAEAFSWDTPPVLASMDSKPYPTILFYGEGHKAGEDVVSPMTPELYDWLAALPGDRTGRVAPLPVLANEASRWITDLGEKCGIVVNDEGKAASAHDIRRAFGSRWAKVVRPLTLQRLMRHKDFTTTLKYYIGLDAEDAGSELWGVPKSVPKTASIPHPAASTGSEKRGKKQRSA